MYQQRFEKMMSKMRDHGVDQLIVAMPSSIYYLTGKKVQPGERLYAILIDVDGSKNFIVNKLFCITEASGLDLIVYDDSENPIQKIAPMIKPNGTLGIEKTWEAHFLIELMESVSSAKIVNGSLVIDQVRMIKDQPEIELMQKSSQINDATMAELIKNLRQNESEKVLSAKTGEIFEAQGGNGKKYFASVAYGSNASDPHHASNETLAQEGQSIVMDIGSVYQGYFSDMTRTVFFGEPSAEHRKIYETVKQSNLAAEAIVRPGVKFSDIDKAARVVIEKAGYGPYFTHRTGHNIGLDVHEYPDVSSVNDMLVEEGMIFSIEPGIYLPNDIGVRIEDLVRVTADGCEVLNNYTKDLQVV